MKTLLRIAALAAAAALSAVPAVSQAAVSSTTQAVHANYDTTFGPIMGFAVPWSGKLQLTFTPDGIIQGYYRPDDNGAFVPVTGGRQGDSVWLDIGRSGNLRVTGTVQNNRIVGAAVDDRTQQEYAFNAQLSAGR